MISKLLWVLLAVSFGRSVCSWPCLFSVGLADTAEGVVDASLVSPLLSQSCSQMSASCFLSFSSVFFFVFLKIIEGAIDTAPADIHVADNHIHSRRFAQRYEFLLECIF